MKKAQEFIDKQEIMGEILSISQKQAEALGVSRKTFQGIKKRMGVIYVLLWLRV